MKVRQTFGADVLDVEGDAAFVAWAANAFNTLILQQRHAEIELNKMCLIEREKSRLQSRAERAYQISVELRRIIRDFSSGDL